jgi:glycosyltransferase involved in cell wall biosynthesis
VERVDMGKAFPGVSVIIPFYNSDHQQMIETLDSVAAQTHPAVEVVVVDDGSSARGATDFLDALAQRNGVSVVRQENRGPAAAKNTGIATSNAKYILPLDSDDLIGPDYLRRATEILEERPDVHVVYCDGEYFGDHSGPISLPRYSRRTMLTQNSMFNSCVFRRDSWEMVSGYNERMVYGLEDHEFWLRLCGATGAPYKIPETMFHYRIRPGSRNGSVVTNREHYVQSFAEMFRNNHALYAEYPDVLFRIIEETRANSEYWEGRYWAVDRLLDRVKPAVAVAHRLRRGQLRRWL